MPCRTQPSRRSVALHAQRRLRGRQPRHRHAVRAAGHIIQPHLLAERDRGRVAAVLAADAELQAAVLVCRPFARRRCAPSRPRPPRRSRRTGPSAGCPARHSCGRNFPASSRDRPNTVCVRSLVPKLKKSATSAILSAISAARGSSIIVPTLYSIVVPGLGEHLLRHLVDLRAGDLQFLRHADQRDHDLRHRRLACFLRHQQRALEDRARLHLVDFRVGNAQPAAAMARASGWLRPVPRRGGASPRGRCRANAATSSSSASLCGRNSCSGGSSSRMVTGRSPMMRNRSWKSPRWNGSSLDNAARRPASSCAMIIWRTALMRSGSKNMCSVRQRPMPSAPNFFAVSASSGVSALARTSIRRVLSAHSISVAKSPDMAASIIATLPTNTSPVAPSSVIVSPARIVLAAGGQCLRVVVDRDAAGACHAGPTHAARHHRGMAGHAAARRSGCRGLRACHGCLRGWSRRAPG